MPTRCCCWRTESPLTCDWTHFEKSAAPSKRNRASPRREIRAHAIASRGLDHVQATARIPGRLAGMRRVAGRACARPHSRHPASASPKPSNRPVGSHPRRRAAHRRSRVDSALQRAPPRHRPRAKPPRERSAPALLQRAGRGRCCGGTRGPVGLTSGFRRGCYRLRVKQCHASPLMCRGPGVHPGGLLHQARR